MYQLNSRLVLNNLYVPNARSDTQQLKFHMYTRTLLTHSIGIAPGGSGGPCPPFFYIQGRRGLVFFFYIKASCDRARAGAFVCASSLAHADRNRTVYYILYISITMYFTLLCASLVLHVHKTELRGSR